MSQRAYFGIWVVLVGMVGLSIAMGSLGSRFALTGIFAIAAFKAYLVLAYYMHLKPENHLVKLMLIGAFLCLVVLFFGLIPDIVMDPHKYK
jgi:caa(3)-type oxidase subunit IV